MNCGRTEPEARDGRRRLPKAGPQGAKQDWTAQLPTALKDRKVVGVAKGRNSTVWNALRGVPLEAILGFDGVATIKQQMVTFLL